MLNIKILATYIANSSYSSWNKNTNIYTYYFYKNLIWIEILKENITNSFKNVFNKNCI